MKNIKDFILENINESRLEDILDEVENWFWHNCGSDGYNNERDRINDLEAMVHRSNDIMVDNCICTLDITRAEATKYEDDITNKLAKLANYALKNNF